MCGMELETFAQVHLQSENCTGELQDAEGYRDKYPDSPTRTEEMHDRISDALSST